MKLIGDGRAGVGAAKMIDALVVRGVVVAYGGLLWILMTGRIGLPGRTTTRLCVKRVWRSIEVARRVRIRVGARRRSARLVRRSTHVGCCCGVGVL